MGLCYDASFISSTEEFIISQLLNEFEHIKGITKKKRKMTAEKCMSNETISMR